MAYDEGLAEQVREVFAGKRGITEKKMFGGLCFLMNGNMVVGVSKNELLVRFGADQHDEVMRLKHVRPMDFTKKPMRGYAFVGPKAFDSDAELEAWVERCARFVGTLPGK